MKNVRWHLVVFLITAFVALGAIGRDLWFQAIAFDPADFDLPPSAREVVKLRTEKTVTFSLGGNHYVTFGRSPELHDGGKVEPATQTDSPL